MSLPVRISARAEADLTHQYRWYLENAGVAVAERFLAISSGPQT
jgi:plasmid stabilization system protein ParE